MQQPKSQREKFQEAARKLKTDDDEARFNERLGKIAKAPKPERKNEPMAIYRLSPIEGQTGHPDWAVSDLKQALWVWASDEYEARGNIFRALGIAAKRELRQRPARSPWAQPELTECTIDEPEFEVPVGKVVNAHGQVLNIDD